MSNLQQFELMPCEVKYLSEGICSITFTLPEGQINAFVLMLTSLGSLFRNLGWKAKINIDSIHERNLIKEKESLNKIIQFENDVVALFKKLTLTSTSPREALSLTVSQIFEQYPFSSFDIVKLVLTRHKCLKKTGFYKPKR